MSQSTVNGLAAGTSIGLAIGAVLGIAAVGISASNESKKNDGEYSGEDRYRPRIYKAGPGFVVGEHSIALAKTDPYSYIGRDPNQSEPHEAPEAFSGRGPNAIVLGGPSMLRPPTSSTSLLRVADGRPEWFDDASSQSPQPKIIPFSATSSGTGTLFSFVSGLYSCTVNAQYLNAASVPKLWGTWITFKATTTINGTEGKVEIDLDDVLPSGFTPTVGQTLPTNASILNAPAVFLRARAEIIQGPKLQLTVTTDDSTVTYDLNSQIVVNVRCIMTGS